MSKDSCDQEQEPTAAVPDISLVATTRLVPQHAQVARYAQQIAHHEAEIGRLGELVTSLEEAIRALMTRLRLTTEPGRYEALRHNCADLQRFKLEVESLRAEHQRALDRLKAEN